MTRDWSRRRWLATIGATVTAATVPLAGCSGGSGGSGDGGGGAENSDGGGSTTTTSDGSNGGGSDEWVQTDTVDMTDELTFEPKQIEVASGTTVTWVNVGTIGHTVTAYEDEIPDGAAYFASGGFDTEQAAVDGYPSSGNIPEGDSYEHTFETPGTYEYYCIPHELSGMVGTVKVT